MDRKRFIARLRWLGPIAVALLHRVGGRAQLAPPVAGQRAEKIEDPRGTTTA